MTFDARVKKHIAERLQVEYLLDAIRYGLLRDIIEECFLLAEDILSVEKKAEVILSALFAMLVRGFDFGAFLAKLEHSEQARFLTMLLFHIYYLNLTLEHLAEPEKLEFYLLRTVALGADIKVVAALYDSYSLDKRLRCLGFCLKNFDEGSYRILQHAESFDVPEVQELLDLADKKVVSAARVSSWLEASQTKPDLKKFLLKLRSETKEAVKEIKTHFPYTESEVSRFCSIFGIYDHQVPKEAWSLHEYPSLEEKLSSAKKKTKAFKDSISAHIQALCYDPDQYIKGINFITYALPTAGKDLSLYAWLPSVAKAIEGFCTELKIPNTIPIFVFDQSEPKLFAKNAKYIKTVSSNCKHIGTDAVLQLAKKLNIEKLLETDSDGHFGYGGARNSIFLLMPLLRYYNGSIDYALDLSEKTLQEDFKKVVLDETAAPCVIHMGDDDVHVPFSTVFSDALFAWQHKDEYFCRFGWVKGRRTTWTETSFNLEYMLERSQDIILQHGFQDEPFRHGMAGLLSKPKLCLNVPFGQEEAYLLAMDEYLFDLRHPMLHLSGYRFPKVDIPTNRFAGLAAFLKGHYRYSVGSMLVSDLLDPLNFYKRCCLPWNMVKENFTSLHDAIEHIVAPHVVEQMQQGFAKNIANLEKGLQHYEKKKLKKSNLAIFHLSVLEIQDVDTILAKYSRFTKEVAELKALFIDLAEDAKSFKEVLAGSKKHLPEDRLAITHALQLMMHVINNATFQKILSKLV